MYFLALIPILIWSLAPITGALSQNNYLLSLLSYSFLFGALFFITYTLIQKYIFKKKYNFKIIKNKHFVLYVLMCVVTFLTYQGTYYYGVTHYNPVEINTLNYLWAIFIPLLSSFFLKNNTKTSIYDWLMVILAFLSITFITNVWDNINNFNLGHFLMILGAISTSLTTVITLKIKEKYKNTPPEITYTFFLTILTISIFTYNFLFDIKAIYVSYELLLMAFVLGFVMEMGRPIWYYLLDKLNKAKLTAIFLLTPVIGNLWLILFFNLKITSSMIIGFVIMMCVLVLNNDIVKPKITTIFKIKK